MTARPVSPSTDRRRPISGEGTTGPSPSLAASDLGYLACLYDLPAASTLNGLTRHMKRQAERE
jgi:hypothetical protein